MSLAATCGWLVLGGATETLVGVAVGGVGLAGLVSTAVRRHGPESEAALRAIRTRVLLRETLRGIGSVEQTLDAVQSDVARSLDFLQGARGHGAPAVACEQLRSEIVANERWECVVAVT